MVDLGTKTGGARWAGWTGFTGSLEKSSLPGMKNAVKTVVTLSGLFLAGQLLAADDTVLLEGAWHFALDPKDAGVTEQWCDKTLTGQVKLPGSLQEQGFGDDITVDTKWTGQIVDRSWFNNPEYEPYRKPGNVKVPFWLQPDKHYVGAAWYQREVEIPPAWKDQRIVLHLERPHWETTVWVDRQRMGSQNSLTTPHEYDLTQALTPGRHRLTLRVDNRLVVEVGVNAHSVSDHTQGNWNGVVGRLFLRTTPRVWIDSLDVYPQIATRSVLLKGRLGNLTGQPGQGTLNLAVRPAQEAGAPPLTRGSLTVSWDQTGGSFETNYPLGPQAALWDEFHPALYVADAVFNDGAHARSAGFGLREAGRSGTQITLNGRKLFLRGTLECCIHPLHGYPPTDVEGWRRILRIARAHGLNHLRFHSWCPPEAAFAAADELGFYYYVECPSWANSGSSVGDGRPLDRWLYEEGDRMLRAYGNHPSFLMMSYGNEPAGRNQNRWLGDLVKYWKNKDARRLYTSGAGWPMIPENDFHITPSPRIQAWGEGLKSRINARPPETMTDYRDFIQTAGAPVVSHEIGQWCVYPNFDEIQKYTGLLKPRNFEIFQDFLRARGLGDLAHQFLLASGKLQTLCYKEDIESALRTPGMAGFELLDLHDFPGQGTALVGVLDPFWDSKGYVTPTEFHDFNCETVPLARMKKRILQNSETFTAQIEVAHFGPQALENAKPQWFIRDAEQTTLASGVLDAKPIPTGTQTRLGEVTLPLGQFTKARKLELSVALAGVGLPGGGTLSSRGYSNSWDFWVYPAPSDTPPTAGIHLAEQLDETALGVLRQGGKVLLLPPPERIKGDALGRVKIGFSSIFWNSAWTARQPPHTLGILCDPKHPALADFPTEYHSNWQWWELVSRSHPFILNDTPRNFRPLVMAIDDWVTARKLGLVFEAQVGGGKLLACGVDLANDLETRPVARQLRRSLLTYMAGPSFQPATKLEAAYLQSLLQDPTAMQKLGARALRADSTQEGYEASNLLDGDPKTMWHTAWGDGAPAFPHEVVLQFARLVTLRAVSLLARQDRNPNGMIKGCALYASADGQTWGEPVARATLKQSADEQTIRLPAPTKARYVKLVALSSFDPAKPYASLAELRVEAD